MPAFEPTPRAKQRPLSFLVAMYCAWFSAGHLPFWVAFEGARSPSDFTRDFVSARALSRGELLSELDGARGNAEAVSIGAEPVIIIENSPFHLHPPPASLPVRLLVPLGFKVASAVWLALSIAALAWLAWLISDIVRRVGAPTPIGPVALFGLLLLWPPTLTNLALGQWSPILAALIAAGYSAWDVGERRRGALWIAGAAALKLTPGALFPYIALRDKRAAAAFAALVAAAIAVALPLGGGVDAWKAFICRTEPNVTHWVAWWHNTLSVRGLLARCFIGAHFAQPLLEAPRVAQGLAWLISAALILTALAATRAVRPAHGRGVEGCAFAMWGVLAVVLNPLAWAHYALLLVLPMALVWRVVADQRAALPARGRRRARLALAVTSVGLTIPKETIYLIVRPLPSAPWKAPFFSLHLFAALLLFATAGWIVRVNRGTEAGPS